MTEEHKAPPSGDEHDRPTDLRRESPGAQAAPEVTPGQVAWGIMAMLASTRTAVVLLAVIAAATVVGTVLPNPVALDYVYGRLWFHVLLGMLALNLAACMVWRKRVGLARIWSLLTHVGILLVLVGALVTLVWSERGYIPLEPGMVGDRFWPYGVDMRSEPGKPLGFNVRLVDFDIDFYRPADVVTAWRGEDLVAEVRLRRDAETEVPGTGLRVARPAFTPDEGPGLVEYTDSSGARRSVPAEVGTVRELPGTDASLRIMLYLPSFVVVDGEDGQKQIASETYRPRNPAIHVALVRDGKTQMPQWLFARAPGHEHGDGLDLRFMHPSIPTLEADVVSASGTRRVRIESGGAVHSPWGDGIAIQYAREPYWKVSDYRSEVEVLDGDRVLRRHVITVNSPLAHEGTKLSQTDFDQQAGLYTVLGVSRDPGVWFVYAGFLAGVAGVMGRFYLVPLFRKLRAGRRREEA